MTGGAVVGGAVGGGGGGAVVVGATVVGSAVVVGAAVVVVVVGAVLTRTSRDAAVVDETTLGGAVVLTAPISSVAASEPVSGWSFETTATPYRSVATAPAMTQLRRRSTGRAQMNIQNGTIGMHHRAACQYHRHDRNRGHQPPTTAAIRFPRSAIVSPKSPSSAAVSLRSSADAATE